MQAFQWGRLRALKEADEIRVLAVKEAYHDAPFADAMIGIDVTWLNQEIFAIRKLAERMPVVLALRNIPNPTLDVAGATYHLRSSMNRFPMGGDTIDANNSGKASLNYAVLKGAKRIALFGFDYSTGHYCPDRYAKRTSGSSNKYIPQWAKEFNGLSVPFAAAGISVFNGCPHSNLTAFPRGTHDEAFAYLRGL